MSDNDLIIFNGINGSTGEYLFEGVTVEGIAKVSKGEQLSESDLQDVDYIRALDDQRSQPHFGVDGGEEVARDVMKAGWGVVFAAEMSNRDAIIEALKPLLDYREKQVGKERFKKLVYINNGKDHIVSNWLARNGVAPAVVKPEKVPYYLLLVGSAEDIPFSFQFTLDAQYAVGRVHFDTVQEYAAYAKQVVDREMQANAQNKELVLFGVQNNHDKATESSIKYLIDPLHKIIGEQHQGQGWGIRRIEKQAATKTQLRELLHQEKPPAFILTASHGMGFVPNDPRQIQDQGALLCSDWPGSFEWTGKPIPKDFYFAADDVQPSANLQGAMLLLFACYSGGTPKGDNFTYEATSTVKQIAPENFISALPKRLLTAGASAIIAHIDRAWATSFIGQLNLDNTGAFKGVIDEVFAGIPIGHAMRYINEYYSSMESQMGNIKENMKMDPFFSIKDSDLSTTYISKNDARNYILLGDPASRLYLNGIN